MLFGFGEIEGRAQELFGAWLSQIHYLQDARTLYLSGVYGGGYIEHRLLALTQAAEALHRRFFQDRYMEQAAFDAEVLEPLVKAIPVGAVGPLRQGLRDRLKFANEHSLRKRLRTLFDTHESVLTALVDKPTELVSPIVDARNEFTHFPVPEAELSPPHSRPRANRVIEFNWVLRLLLESCFLQTMGFEIGRSSPSCVDPIPIDRWESDFGLAAWRRIPLLRGRPVPRTDSRRSRFLAALGEAVILGGETLGGLQASHRRRAVV